MDPAAWGQWRRQERREALVPDLQSLIVLRGVRNETKGWEFRFSSKLEFPQFHLNTRPPYGQE